MNYEVVIPILLSIMALGVSYYSARNSANKNVVESLGLLVDKLERNLEVETRERKELQQRVEFYKRYIDMLLEQLRKNNITPEDPPEFHIRTVE